MRYPEWLKVSSFQEFYIASKEGTSSCQVTILVLWDFPHDVMVKGSVTYRGYPWVLCLLCLTLVPATIIAGCQDCW